jgi:molybdate transport system substrate-binding protein
MRMTSHRRASVRAIVRTVSSLYSIVRVVGLALVLVGASCKSDRSKRVVRIAAASDLAKAFGELSKEFASRTGITPEISFGSSGLFAKQIEQGAPFFLYAAANRSFTAQVIKRGVCDRATQHLYALGRIVVWTAPGKSAPTTLADLAKPEFKKIAIANPEHAPYGVAAQQALSATGVWDSVKDRIVLGENVLATMLYAKEGSVDAAIIALSLTAASTGGTTLKIDPALHAPLEQALVVCGKGPEADAAKQFADFIGSAEGREVMARYGFTQPDVK